jgi:hypothetical protein
MVAMRSARTFTFVLLALLVWGVSVPLMAVTCVPSAPCAGMGPCPLAARAADPTVPGMASPDCCERSTRESAPPVLPGAQLQALGMADLPVARIISLPPAPVASSYDSTVDPAGAAVPLYTLHSILLI